MKQFATAFGVSFAVSAIGAINRILGFLILAIGIDLMAEGGVRSSAQQWR